MFRETFGREPLGEEASIDISVIAIFTKRGNGLLGALDSKRDVDIMEIPVFSIQREFYTPKHDSDNTDISFPDFRSLIYWNPNVSSKEESDSTVNYYHSDNTGEFTLVLEAISESGEIGYTTLNYKVIDEYRKHP